jgi:hypothetical protein
MIKSGLFRRVSFVIVAAVTAPVWFVVVVLVVLAAVVAEFGYWVQTGQNGYSPAWIDRLFLMAERWVRSWLRLPEINRVGF